MVQDTIHEAIGHVHKQVQHPHVYFGHHLPYGPGNLGGATDPTGCVPYDPGYEYVQGLPTYNPVACPVPTPVNF